MRPPCEPGPPEVGPSDSREPLGLGPPRKTVSARPGTGFPWPSRAVTVTVPAWVGVSESESGEIVSVAADEGFTATGP